jgi:predicted nuclease of predicted toxin-antitoxin system
MMLFIVDTQLPPLLAQFLVYKGHNAIHTTAFPDGHLLKDQEIVRIAIEESRTIVSKDRDFLDNYLLRGAPPKVILLQFGNIHNQDLVAHFGKNLDQIVGLLSEGANLILFEREKIMSY